VNPSVLSDPRLEARAMVRRSLFGTFAVVSTGGALLAATNDTLPVPLRAALAIGLLLITTLSLLARPWDGSRSDAAMVLVCVAGIVMICAAATVNGWGMNSPSIGFFAVFTFLIGATVNARLGVLIALASAGSVLALGWAEHAQWIRGAEALVELPLRRRLIVQMMLLAVGLAGGLLVTRVFNHYLGSGRERELRFQGLLGIAADSYWEMDRDNVITSVWRRQDDHSFVVTPQPLTRPWDQPDLLYDDGALAGHQTDLAARRPFRDLHVRWRRPDGEMRHELVSGEPRFDAAGRFLGYWGVSRDITDRVAAAEALRRSEAMLSHLVTTSPDLITLSDLTTGRYLMVNEAFTRFFGHSVAESVGRTSTELGIWAEPGSREELVRRVRADGVVSDMQIEYVAKSGRHLSLRISGASFRLDDGEFLVVTGRDVTASEQTRLAHEAVLANASLGIAFTRAGSFVQANPALESMLGWPAGTLAGQPGRVIWRSDTDHGEVATALIGAPLARGEPVEFVRELRRHDGSAVWCRLLAKAVNPSHPLRGGTIWIIEDITERRRFEQTLAKARDDAEAANRAKSAFLANTSHEIRTPLNGLVGLARLARRPDLDEARRCQYLEQIGESAETLSAVISDVLDLSKIEAGKLDVERLPFDLGTLLRTLHQVYATLAEARGLGFALQLEPGLPHWVLGDPVRVRQVLGNYLSNALKFTERGEVRLQVGRAGGDLLRFEVHDTGLGIAPGVQARLFQPFTQADQSTTRRFGGSGLGLSICRELAALMHGRVGVDSEPGHGSCFWAELPLPRAEAPASSAGNGALPTAQLNGARVLMAEDNPVNMTIAVAMLEQWGVAVTQANDGAQAVAAVEHAARAGQPFDAVLMDVQMPVMSGYDATRRLRSQPGTQALPIIALTAAALTSEREQALASGMSGFLTKPIDAQRLHDTLARAIGRIA